MTADINVCGCALLLHGRDGHGHAARGYLSDRGRECVKRRCDDACDGVHAHAHVHGCGDARGCASHLRARVRGRAGAHVRVYGGVCGHDFLPYLSPYFYRFLNNKQ